MLFILNGAIHEVETRFSKRTGEKRSCKYFNAFIVHVMLVGYLTFEIHAAGNYHKVIYIIKYTYYATKLVLSLCERIQIDPGQFNTTRCGPL